MHFIINELMSALEHTLTRFLYIYVNLMRRDNAGKAASEDCSTYDYSKYSDCTCQKWESEMGRPTCKQQQKTLFLSTFWICFCFFFSALFKQIAYRFRSRNVFFLYIVCLNQKNSENSFFLCYCFLSLSLSLCNVAFILMKWMR